MVGDNDNIKDPLAGYTEEEKLLIKEFGKFVSVKTPETILRRARAIINASKRYSDREAY